MAAMPMRLIEVQSMGQDLAQRTVCVKVRLGRLGNTRKVSNSQVEVDTDKSLTRDFQTSARFQRAAHDRQLRWRDPALPLRYVSAVRGRHSSLPAGCCWSKWRASCENSRHAERIDRSVPDSVPDAVPGGRKSAALALQSDRLPAVGVCCPAVHPYLAVHQLWCSRPTSRDFDEDLARRTGEGGRDDGGSGPGNPAGASDGDGRVGQAHARSAEGRPRRQAAAVQRDHGLEPGGVPGDLRFPERH